MLSSLKSAVTGVPATGKPNTAFPHLDRAAIPGKEDVVKLLKEGKVKNLIVMAGAGISTSAGIPDFRSPGTGLYDNLAKYNLPYPEAIFDLDYLEERPDAFYTLAKELYPGNFKPTTTHYFLKLLQDKGVLKGVWTQNIDTLERLAGIEDEFIVEAHGSFANATCLNCEEKYTQEEIKPRVLAGEVVRCQEAKCKGKKEALIKPDIVFFGEGLPSRFFDRMPHFQSCDLLLVLGTSLTVGPFNSLLHRVPSSCPRVLLNLEPVGEATHARNDGFDFEGITGRTRTQGVRDVKWLGKTDECVEELCRMVGDGWAEELAKLKRKGWARIDATEAEAREEEEEAWTPASPLPASSTAPETPKEAQEKREEVIEAVQAATAEGAGEKRSAEEDEAVSAPKEGELLTDSVVEALTKAVEGVDLDAEKIVEAGAAKSVL